MKSCSKCGVEKPFSSFAKDSHKASGYVSRCRQCVAERDAERNANLTPEQRAARRDRQRTRYQQDEAYAKTLRDKSLAATRANPEANRKRVADWRAANAQRHRANARNWQKENPVKAQLISARKRAAKGKAQPSWADERAIRAVYEKARELRVQGVPVQVDHVVPLQGENVCGLHVEYNLRLLDATENARKGNRYAPE